MPIWINPNDIEGTCDHREVDVEAEPLYERTGFCRNPRCATFGHREEIRLAHGEEFE